MFGETLPKPDDKILNMDKAYRKEIQSDKIVVKNRGEATVKILETFKRAQQENYASLDFHNEKHPEAVRRSALEFAKIIMRVDRNLVTKDTLADIVNSAASHDSVLNVVHGDMIMRFRGFFETDIEERYRGAMRAAGILKGNELLSAEWLERELDRYVDVDGLPIFDTQSKTDTVHAIAATFPKFDFKATISDQNFEEYFSDERTKDLGLEKYRTGIKIWQPHLRADSSITVLAVATGDLRGGVSSHDYQDYWRSGNNEFRELNEGLRLALQDGIEKIPRDKKIKAAEDMLGWVRSQVTFAMWQKILFWESIDKNQLIAGSANSDEIKKALKDYYNPNFDANILKAVERYEHLEEKYGKAGEKRAEHMAHITDEDFRGLLNELGFSSGAN